MAQFSLEINDESLETVFDSFATQFNYNSNKTGEETKQDFTRRQVIEWIKQVVINQVSDKAAQDARIATQQQTRESLTIE